MNPEQIALILIDVQRDFWRPFKDFPEFVDFPRNVGSLLSDARAKGFTVVHTQASFKPDCSDWMLFYRQSGRGDVPCIAGTEGALFEDFATPLPNEHVITKQTFDGFVGTDLGHIMYERDVKAALIAGLETSVCVLFTATSAYLRRIIPLLITDACGDEPLRHKATLRMYGDLCFKTVALLHANELYGFRKGLVVLDVLPVIHGVCLLKDRQELKRYPRERFAEIHPVGAGLVPVSFPRVPKSAGRANHHG